MIVCQCSQKIYSMRGFLEVKSIGFALFGTCPKCGRTIPASTLFRITERAVKKADRTYLPKGRSVTKNRGFEASEI